MLLKIAYLQTHGLLVLEKVDVIITQLLNTFYSRRNDIGNRAAAAIFFQVYSKHIKRGWRVRWNGFVCANRIQFKTKTAPLVTHQLQFCETAYYRIFKIGHEHTHETYGFKIGNITHFLFVLSNRNAEKEPGLTNAIRYKISSIRNKILSRRKLRRHQVNLILKIFFQLIEGVIPVKIFLVGI